MKSFEYNVNSIISPFPKVFVVKIVILESTETQSIGIHDVIFNAEFAMHYRLILKQGCFQHRFPKLKVQLCICGLWDNLCT